MDGVFFPKLNRRPFNDVPLSLHPKLGHGEYTGDVSIRFGGLRLREARRVSTPELGLPSHSFFSFGRPRPFDSFFFALSSFLFFPDFKVCRRRPLRPSIRAEEIEEKKGRSQVTEGAKVESQVTGDVGTRVAARSSVRRRCWGRLTGRWEVRGRVGSSEYDSPVHLLGSVHTSPPLGNPSLGPWRMTLWTRSARGDQAAQRPGGVTRRADTKGGGWRVE